MIRDCWKESQGRIHRMTPAEEIQGGEGVGPRRSEELSEDARCDYPMQDMNVRVFRDSSARTRALMPTEVSILLKACAPEIPGLIPSCRELQLDGDQHRRGDPQKDMENTLQILRQDSSGKPGGIDAGVNHRRLRISSSTFCHTLESRSILAWATRAIFLYQRRCDRSMSLFS